MRLLPLTVVTATVLAAPAVPANAAWTEQRLPPRGTTGYEPPALAANARGDAAVVWGARPHRFLAVRRSGRARFGRSIALSERGVAHRVAVLSDGTVLVGWLSLDGTASRDDGPRAFDCCRVAYVQRLRPGSRRLSAPRIATTRGVGIGDWSLVAGPGGRAALIGNAAAFASGVRQGIRGGVTLATSRRGGLFGAPVATTTRAFEYRPPFVRFGGDGRAIGLWLQSGTEPRLAGAPIARDGRLSAARTDVLPTAGGGGAADLLDFDAGLDRRSHLTAIWTSRPAVVGFQTRVMVASGKLTGRLAGPQLLEQSLAAANGVVDVAPSGRAIAVWGRYGPDGREQTGLAIRRSARGRFRVLSPLPGPSGGVAVTLSSGDGVVVLGRRSVIARTVRADGRIGPIRRLGGFDSGLGAGAVGAVATAGRVTIAWGTGSGLRVATYRR